MIVLDASALVDLVVDQRSASWVLGLLDEFKATAPAHQPAEVLSALARMIRAAELDEPSARAALDEALMLPQRLIVPSAAHVRRAYELRDRIRVSDGLYVALAEELGCPLVTTDRRLAAAGPPCEIRTPPGDPNAGAVPPPRHP